MSGPTVQTTSQQWLRKHGGHLKSLGGHMAFSMGLGALTGQSFGETLTSTVKSTLTHTLFPSIGLPMMLTPLVQLGAHATKTSYDTRREQYRRMFEPNTGGRYQDTQQAYTMRQRAVQAIQQSGMNARSALGGTARMMHRL